MAENQLSQEGIERIKELNEHAKNAIWLLQNVQNMNHADISYLAGKMFRMMAIRKESPKLNVIAFIKLLMNEFKISNDEIQRIH
jgi:hypothetical protein